MDERGTLQCLPEDLERRGDSPAILTLRGTEVREISFGRLADECREVARAAVALGIERGEHVALLGAASPAWITTCLGLLRAGAVPVPVDTQIEDEPLTRLLRDASVEVVVADESRRTRLEEMDVDLQILPIEDRSSWPREVPGRESPHDTDLPGRPEADETALLFFTSGTTGPPKGVPLRQRNLRFQVDAIEDTEILDSGDRLLLPLPLHHVYPLVIGVLAPLSLGMPIVLPESRAGSDFLRALERTGATIIIGVPRLYSGLRESLLARIRSMTWPVRPGLRGLIAATTWLRARTGLNAGRVLLKPLRSRLGEALRVLASGGSPLDPELARFLNGLGFDVAIGYGLTETAPLLTVNPPGSRRLASVGRSLPRVDLRLDHDATDEEEGGEILARGPGVFSGYLGLEEETRESFTDDGWYRTGDLGHFDDDGYLYVRGRKSTMIVTASGENLRTEALEEAYADDRRIAEIGVLKVDDRLAAVVRAETSEVREESSSVEEAVEAALDEVSQSMPSYQRLDTFRVTSKPLERTRLGKIKRHRLRERYDALSEGEGDEPTGPMAIEDMTASDRELLRDETAREVWELLARRFPEEALGPDTDIRADLGVDSLGWIELGMDIAQETGVEVDEEQIEHIDTVRDLLESVRESEPSEGDARAPLEDPASVLTADQEEWLEQPTGSRRRAARLLWGIDRLLVRAVFGVRASGTDRVRGGPLVVAPNHTSFLDPFVVGATLPRDVLAETHWGGWTGYTLRNRIFRTVSRWIGVVPVDPQRAMISSLAFGVAALRRGRHLVWFPEGERSHDGELQELRPGIGALLETVDDARVVPVAIDGAFEAWPPHRSLPRIRRIRVHYGEAITADELEQRGEGESTRDRIVDGLRRVMEELRTKDA